VVVPGGRTEALPPVCLPYSPEYAPDAATDGAAVLEALADATGGAHVADAGSVWATIPRGRRRVALAPFLYLAAALFFLIEVFERRTGWLDARRRPRAGAAGAGEGSGNPPEAATAALARAGDEPPPASAGVTEEEAAPASAESPLARAKRRARERGW